MKLVPVRDAAGLNLLVPTFSCQDLSDTCKLALELFGRTPIPASNDPACVSSYFVAHFAPFQNRGVLIRSAIDAATRLAKADSLFLDPDQGLALGTFSKERWSTFSTSCSLSKSDQPLDAGETVLGFDRAPDDP